MGFLLGFLLRHSQVSVAVPMLAGTISSSILALQSGGN